MYAKALKVPREQALNLEHRQVNKKRRKKNLLLSTSRKDCRRTNL
jgi:hypothetical protein